jgi:hypothetical protein
MGLDANRQRAAMQLAGRLNYDEFCRLCERMRNEQAADPLFDLADFALVQDEYVEQLQAEALVLGIKQLARLVDDLFTLVDMDAAVDGNDPARKLLARVRANLDYRVRGEGAQAAGRKRAEAAGR